MMIDERHRSTLVHGLRVAAERFDDHAKTIRRCAVEGCESDGVIDVRRRYDQLNILADQFDRQARDSRTLADRIEEGELSPDEPTSRS